MVAKSQWGLTNSGLNGYSALYLQSRLQGDLTRNETGQVYVGGQGMTVQTRTNHPLHLKSYCDEVGVVVPNSLTISNNGSNWTFKLVSSLKSSELSASEGVEFDEETLDGRKSRSLITAEGENKLVHVQKGIFVLKYSAR